MTFDHEGRKNSQFRQGATVTVSAIPHAEVCPVRLLRELQKLVESDQESFIFRGFNGRLVAKSPGKTTPYVERIKYDQFLRYLALWFSGVLGISSNDFRKHGAVHNTAVRTNTGIPRSYKIPAKFSPGTVRYSTVRYFVYQTVYFQPHQGPLSKPLKHLPSLPSRDHYPTG